MFFGVTGPCRNSITTVFAGAVAPHRSISAEPAVACIHLLNIPIPLTDPGSSSSLARSVSLRDPARAHFDRHVGEAADLAEARMIERRATGLVGHHREDGAEVAGSEAPEVQVGDPIAI